MSKACQYAMNETKVSVSMKEAQAALQKIIIWTKKSSKGRLEWEKACHELIYNIENSKP
jgi:hypothetical protein